MKITDENRQAVIRKIADSRVDGMDEQALIAWAIDAMVYSLENEDDDFLLEEFEEKSLTLEDEND